MPNEQTTDPALELARSLGSSLLPSYWAMAICQLCYQHFTYVMRDRERVPRWCAVCKPEEKGNA